MSEEMQRRMDAFASKLGVTAELAGAEAVNHPPHYGGDTTYEAIKVIEAWQLGFHDGNAVKYICRAAHKGNQKQDLEKARWYLDRLIETLSASEDPQPGIQHDPTTKGETDV